MSREKSVWLDSERLSPYSSEWPTLLPVAHTVDRAEQSTGQGLGEAENTTHARSFSQETEQNLSLNLENAAKETIK